MRHLFKIFFLIFLIVSNYNVRAQNKSAFEVTAISLKNKQIKSIIKNVHKRFLHSSRNSYWVACDLVLAKKGDSLYIQITGITKPQINSVFNNVNQKLYGCFMYKDRQFFVSTYKDQVIPSIHSIFVIEKRKQSVILSDTRSIGIVENPLWLYLYSGSGIKLIKTANLEYL